MQMQMRNLLLIDLFSRAIITDPNTISIYMMNPEAVPGQLLALFMTM